MLYKDKQSRPNIAINILVNLEALKVEFGWSDEGIYDGYSCNLQVRNVLGEHELIEEDFNFRTEYNFRRRLNQYKQEHGIKLLHVAF